MGDRAASRQGARPRDGGGRGRARRHDRDRGARRGPRRAHPRRGGTPRPAVDRQPQRGRAVCPFRRDARDPGGREAGHRGGCSPRPDPHDPSRGPHAVDGSGRGRVSQGRRPAPVQGAVDPDPRQRVGRGAAHGGRPARRASPADAAPGRLGADDGLNARDEGPNRGRAGPGAGAGESGGKAHSGRRHLERGGAFHRLRGADHGLVGELDGKTALVTGGGKGIGRAISQALAGMGARVIVNYRSDRAAADETAASLPNATAYQADVADPAQVEAMVKAIGKIDVLVNNAGAVRDKLLIQMSPPDWEDLIRTDLLSAFATTRAAIMSGMMRARWGRIVNISSIVGLTGNTGQSNYAAAKAGLIGFTKSVAREYGSRNITCNAIAPGFVRTELTTSSVSEEMVGEMVKMTPIKREGTAEEIAAAVAFLCSQRAGFITGQVLAVDGGLSL